MLGSYNQLATNNSFADETHERPDAAYHVRAPLFFMPRKRGNPKWASGQPLEPTRAVATEFEAQVRQLGLTKETCADSKELRNWCERNRNRYYIPEWLLKAWALPVDPDSS